jgi:hypothetical protein
MTTDDLHQRLEATGCGSEYVDYLLTTRYNELHGMDSVQFHQAVLRSLATYDNDAANPCLAAHMPRITAGKLLIDAVKEEREAMKVAAAKKQAEHNKRIEQMNRRK